MVAGTASPPPSPAGEHSRVAIICIAVGAGFLVLLVALLLFRLGCACCGAEPPALAPNPKEGA